MKDFFCIIVVAAALASGVSSWAPAPSLLFRSAATTRSSRCRETHNYKPLETFLTPLASASSKTVSSLETTFTTQDENTSSDKTTLFQPVLDFSKPETIDMIDRLDDAIMGGISTSTVLNVTDTETGESFAKWVGVCRTDGGGFCGFRTNPFADGQPLLVGTADGLYLDIRLASDNESERRVWKLTTRMRPTRGELLYQAPISFQQPENDQKQWSRVKVPFSSFKLVKGPRMIPDVPPLNTTGGLYQIGMSMSKFQFGATLNELENFRAGFFELQIKEIGLYEEEEKETHKKELISAASPCSVDSSSSAVSSSSSFKVMTREEAKRNRSLLLKLLLPISKMFFSEKNQRRKSAMKILREKRGLTRFQSILFGLRSRSRSYGIVKSIATMTKILSGDLIRFALQAIIRLTIIFPVRLIGGMMSVVFTLFKPKRKTAVN